MKVGDKVAAYRRMIGASHIRYGTVKRITPKGRIVVDFDGKETMFHCVNGHARIGGLYLKLAPSVQEAQRMAGERAIVLGDQGE